MNNDCSRIRHRNVHVLTALLCMVIVVGCGKNQESPKHGDAASDTTRSADSALAADSSGQGLSAQSVKMLSYEETQGAFLYGKYCAVCHGEQGKGDGFNAFNLDPRPRDLSDSTYMRALSDDQILQTISGGGRSVNKSPLMPAYGWTLGRQRLRYVASYVRSFMSQ